MTVASWFRKDTDEDSTDQIAARLIAAADGADVQRPVAVAAPAAAEVERLRAAEPAGVPSVSVPSAEVERLLAERGTLIELCLYALDRARSGGVVERLEEGLASVGVCAARPNGLRFDPAVHEAGGTVPTDDDALDGMVAETEVVGFSDGDKLLRPPIVTVYALRKGAAQ